MIDRLFLATLTFCLLVGGTLAIGVEMFGTPSNDSNARSVTMLPRVVVTGKKAPTTVEVVNAQGAASSEGSNASVQ